MNEVFALQQNPNSFIKNSGLCTLDVTTRIRFTNRSVPITGKKIVSTIQVPMQIEEKSPPSELYRKKSPPKDHSPQVHRHKPHSKSSPKQSAGEKPVAKEKLPKKPVKRPVLLLSKAKKTHTKMTQTKENEEICIKVPKPSTKIKKILKVSLKKEKLRKTLEKINQKKKAELDEEKKFDLVKREIQIRCKNKRCKKVKLHHKFSWGVDQSRFRDNKEQSPDGVTNRKAVSTERVRTGLDTIKEISQELGKSFIHLRKSSHVIDRDEVSRFRTELETNRLKSKDLDTIKEISQDLSRSIAHHRNSSQLIEREKYHKHVPDPEVIRYIKNKNRKKREIEEFSYLHKKAEDVKRNNEIYKISQICNKIKQRRKIKRKKPQKPKKSLNTQQDPEEIRDSDLHTIELVYENPHHSEAQIDNSSLPIKSFQIPEKSFEIPKHLQKPAEISSILVTSAIKIQAMIRGFLTRARLFNQHEFPSSDEQVREILSQKFNENSDSQRESCFSIPVTVPANNLIIDLPSDEPSPIHLSDFSINQSSRSARIGQSDIMDEFDNLQSSQKFLNTFKSLEKTSKKQNSRQELDKSQDEAKEDLKAKKNNIMNQIIIKEAKLFTLESIKEQELHDLQLISSRAGIDKEVNSDLAKIVEKRYEQLSFLLESSYQAPDSSFLYRLETEEHEEFLQELEAKKQELVKRLDFDQLIESPIESFINSKPDTEENRPVIFNPKSKLPVSNESSNIIETPQISNIMQVPEVYNPENMFIEELQLSSESCNSEMGKLEIFSPSFEPEVLEEASLELSSSLNPYDSSLSGHFKYEVSEISHTPEYIPERPSAPLHYFDRESPDTNPSPMLINEHLEVSTNHWLLEMTPELVVDIAEILLMDLIKDHPVFNKSHSIETSVDAIEKYIEEIYTQYNRSELAKDLAVEVPLKKLEILNKVQNDEISHIDIKELISPSLLIDLKVYIDIENQVDSFRSQSTEVIKQKDLDFLIDAQHIHNKAIFDSINEALNKIRVLPAGLPVPLGLNKSLFYNERPEKLLQEAKNKVLMWSTFELGKFKIDESFEGLTEEEALVQVKEDNLVKMIYAEIEDNEVEWTDYSFELLQVKLELSDMVLFAVTEELIILLDNN